MTYDQDYDKDNDNDDIEGDNNKVFRKDRQIGNDIVVRTRPAGGDPCWGLVSVQAVSVASSWSGGINKTSVISVIKGITVVSVVSDNYGK